MPFSPSIGIAILAALVGIPVGIALARWSIRLTPLPDPARADRLTVALTTLGTAAIFATLVYAMLSLRCQETPEVQPSDLWRYGRVGYHLVLAALLIAATATDFRDYVIPDAITIPGTLFGILLAVIAGDLQTIHLWVDWNEEIPGIRGPAFPEWIRQHPHWHGLAWSLAGMAAGAGLTYLVRGLSSWIIGQEALGFGDVTLMAMVGSFLGWQPVVVAFALAPLFGLVVGLALRLAGGRTYLPYGPWLAAGALAVMLGWKWIWMFEVRWSPTSRFDIRRFFGDATGLAIIGGIALASMALLLLLLRIYRNVPGKVRTK